MVKQTICRIDVGEGQKARRGVGFLLEGSRVLTAAHVVASFQDASQPYEQPLTLRFVERHETDGVRLGKELDASIEQFFPDEDFAVLSCSDTPALSPLKLRKLSYGYRVAWSSFGFPNGSENQGLDIEGMTLPVDARIQLTSRVAAGSPHGFSGAPLIVGGDVAGIVVRARLEESTETLYALHLDVAAAKCEALAQRLPKRDPPYVAHVTDLVLAPHRLHLRNPAERLALQRTLRDDELPNALARSMMAGGIKPTLAVLEQLAFYLVSEQHENRARNVLERAAEAWIDGDAAERLWDALRSQKQPQLVLLNSANVKVGEYYSRRARCIASNFPGAGTASVIDPARGDEAAFVDAFERAVARALRCDRSELEVKLKARDLEAKPIVVQVPTPTPTKDEIARILEKNERYAQIKILLLVDADGLDRARTDFPNAVLIEPFHAMETEQLILDTYEWACRELEDAFVAVSE